jgi:hypothetical protein
VASTAGRGGDGSGSGPGPLGTAVSVLLTPLGRLSESPPDLLDFFFPDIRKKRTPAPMSIGVAFFMFSYLIAK